MITDRDQDCIVGRSHHATSSLRSDKKVAAVLQRYAWFGYPYVAPATGRPNHSIVDFKRYSTDDEFKTASGEPIESCIQVVAVSASPDRQEPKSAEECNVE